ncbi:DNA polymerase IV [Conexibacter sp. SYSU D00693]|uniref:DinB/UmuC family translesion DNA polymerase n=1 Tax=Conexibacter sp. SYSU D00693 TaxID=2812560 RepID=UPI0021120744|nr:DNA polymerase IV [Conexibacter sp. SYSU D00693]
MVVESDFAAYREASDQLFAAFREAAPIVQAGSMEEAFLDVRDVGRDPGELATALRARVREEAGLALTVGVARTKVLAKLASRSAKPDGLRVVAPADELAFLHPLALEDVWGVGPATAGRLRAHGVLTVGQAAGLDEATLMRLAGKAAGRYVHTIARNEDLRPVQRRRGRRSFGAQRSLGRRPRTLRDVDEALAGLVDRVAERLQRAGRAGRTVVLRLRHRDMSRTTRSCTLHRATAEAPPLLTAARGLLHAAVPLLRARGITLVGVTVTNLDGPGLGEQLRLALDPPSGSDGHRELTGQVDTASWSM